MVEGFNVLNHAEHPQRQQHLRNRRRRRCRPSASRRWPAIHDNCSWGPDGASDYACRRRDAERPRARERQRLTGRRRTDGRRGLVGSAAAGRDRHLRQREPGRRGHVRAGRCASTAPTATPRSMASSRRRSCWCRGRPRFAADRGGLASGGKQGTALLMARSEDGGRTFGRSGLVPGTDAAGAPRLAVGRGGSQGRSRSRALARSPRGWPLPGARREVTRGTAQPPTATVWRWRWSPRCTRRWLMGSRVGAGASPAASVTVARRRSAAGSRRRACSPCGGRCSRVACATSPRPFSMTADGRSRRATKVSDNRWELNACPDDGPALAVDQSGTRPCGVADARQRGRQGAGDVPLLRSLERRAHLRVPPAAAHGAGPASPADFGDLRW